jgi:hypothetical protein
MSLWSKRIGTKGTHKYTKDSKKKGGQRDGIEGDAYQ